VGVNRVSDFVIGAIAVVVMFGIAYLALVVFGG